jgi:hypothetical protein
MRCFAVPHFSIYVLFLYEYNIMQHSAHICGGQCRRASPLAMPKQHGPYFYIIFFFYCSYIFYGKIAAAKPLGAASSSAKTVKVYIFIFIVLFCIKYFTP